MPLSIGDEVVSGQIIGSVGNTGVRTGTHLHLNIGETLGSYTNGNGVSFPDYQIAEGFDDGGTLLGFIDFLDSPLANQELPEFTEFVSSTAPITSSDPRHAPISDFDIMRWGMLGALEAYKTGTPDDNNTPDDPLGGLELEFGNEITVLTDDHLSITLDPYRHRFNEAGLFIARPNLPGEPIDQETAQAILATANVGGANTLMLSFRGTDSHDARLVNGLPAFFHGQTFEYRGIIAHYEAFRPLIEAAREYIIDTNSNDAITEKIERFIVSGHSLGGTMADVFAVSDSVQFEFIPDLELKVVSVGSAGFDRKIADLLTRINYEVADINWGGHFFRDEITGVNSPEWFLGVSNSLDRVTHPQKDGSPGLLGDGVDLLRFLTPNSVLENNIGFDRSSGFIDIDLPNHDNIDVSYFNSAYFVRGFGLRHNPNLYFNNLQALSDSPLKEFYQPGTSIIMGHGKPFYGALWDETSAGDNGVQFAALQGGVGDDFILGLEGADVLRGGNGNDLLDGGADGDELHGGGGRDSLSGGSGNDRLIGGSENDDLWGGGHNDELLGEGGNDRLFGDGDDDTLNGGSGLDRLWGGPGNDVFVADDGDTIEDYRTGNFGSYSAVESDVVDASSLASVAWAGGAGESVASLVRTRFDIGRRSVLLEVDPGGAGAALGWQTAASFAALPEGARIDLILDAASTTADAHIVHCGSPFSWSITPNSAQFGEADGSATFTLTRPDSAFDQTIYVSTTVVHGSANNGDYTFLVDQPLFIPAGRQSESITIDISDDAQSEVPESFGLIAQMIPDADVTQYLAAATFTIIDDDHPTQTSFTSGDDWVLVPISPGTFSFSDPGGEDTAIVDFSGQAVATWMENYLGVGGGTRIQTYEYTSGQRSTTDLIGVENIVLIGSDYADESSALNGDNLLLGNGGPDWLDGGDGNDTIFGGDGDDLLYGGYGFNVLSGGTGNDYIASAFVDAIDGGGRNR